MRKEWYRSKGIWAGLALILKAILYDFWYLGNAETAYTQFMLGLGLIGIRQAIK